MTSTANYRGYEFAMTIHAKFKSQLHTAAQNDGKRQVHCKFFIANSTFHMLDIHSVGKGRLM